MFTLPKNTEMTTDMLKGFLAQHSSYVANRYKPLEDMYMSKHEILAMEAKAAYKPDNRIVANFAKYIVDTMDGFFVGIPIRVSSGNDVVDEYVRFLSQYSNQDDINAELSKICSIFGHGYEMYYVDDEAELCVTHLRPTEAFMIFDDSILERPMYFVRRYKDQAGGERGSISSVTDIRYFAVVGENGDVEWREDWEPHYFDGVPATEYVGNEERQGLFEPVITVINAYNKAISEKANDVDYFADAYLKVLGAELDETDKQRIRDNRIINFVGDGEAGKLIVEFLDKPDCDQTQENLLDRMEQLIFQLSLVANISDSNFGDATGIALKYKLQPMSNLARVKERKFTASMVRRYKILFSHPIARAPLDAWIGLEYRFTQNVPSNLLEESEIAKNVEGIVSRETQLGIISAVSNVREEVDRLAVERKALLPPEWDDHGGF